VIVAAIRPFERVVACLVAVETTISVPIGSEFFVMP
jgi:hypothetical protein